jgi:hypothetical protein
VTTTRRTWGGTYAKRLVTAVLTNKGTTCHLCDGDGADSADHNPPRSVLIRAGVPNPDAMRYLFPVHWRPCNNYRKDRPVTDELRAECRALFARYSARAYPARSSRFGAR